VLFEISQLLTTVASPVTAIEDQHGDSAMQVIRYMDPAAVHSRSLQPRERVPNPQTFHVRTPVQCDPPHTGGPAKTLP
jgi:hypothetical protein